MHFWPPKNDILISEFTISVSRLLQHWSIPLASPVYQNWTSPGTKQHTMGSLTVSQMGSQTILWVRLQREVNHMLSYVATLSIIRKTQYLLYVTKLGDQSRNLIWFYECIVMLHVWLCASKSMNAEDWTGVGFKGVRGSTVKGRKRFSPHLNAVSARVLYDITLLCPVMQGCVQSKSTC